MKMKIDQNAKATDCTIYTFEDAEYEQEDQVLVEVSDTPEQFLWRLTVNGDSSNWTNFDQGILVHEGYGVASNYWEGVFEIWTPFKIEYCDFAAKNIPQKEYLK